ncbi:MraY family glycosyltransferase [Roseovarius sp. S4756]|uniref:MraY family glycosyltransferase n=1 Tax=Roseovarius maritimus TaxID=3342637 RepID=UPI0037299686
MIYLTPAAVAFLASFVIAVLIVATEKLHGYLSHDHDPGVQKLHQKPVPRIGGLSLVIGFVAGGLALVPDAFHLWLLTCVAAVPALGSGLIEDITKRVSAKWRLLATLCAGLIFIALTGYYIDHTDVLGLDWMLAYKWFAIPFTVIVIAGVANAFNIIDGVNGLSSGTALIILTGFAAVAALEGDATILSLCLVSIGALSGFFLLNFPFGKIFLGDGGAYMTGFLLVVIALMLPLRNSELSPLIGIMALSYPIIEMLVSIRRRMVRRNAHPGKPDRLHLHSLVYRGHARRIAAQAAPLEKLRNPITAALVWPLPCIAVCLMLVSRTNSAGILVSLAIVFILYILTYRRVALMRRAAGRRQTAA